MQILCSVCNSVVTPGALPAGRAPGDRSNLDNQKLGAASDDGWNHQHLAALLKAVLLIAQAANIFRFSWCTPAHSPPASARETECWRWASRANLRRRPG